MKRVQHLYTSFQPMEECFCNKQIGFAVWCYHGRGLAGNGTRVRTHPHYYLHVRCTWPHTEGRCVGRGEPALEQATKNDHKCWHKLSFISFQSWKSDSSCHRRLLSTVSKQWYDQCVRWNVVKITVLNIRLTGFIMWNTVSLSHSTPMKWAYMLLTDALISPQPCVV